MKISRSSSSIFSLLLLVATAPAAESSISQEPKLRRTTSTLARGEEAQTPCPVPPDLVQQRKLNTNASWPTCYDTLNCNTIDFALVTDSLWHSTLNDASFVDTNWENVGFGGSQAKNTDFTRANFMGASANHMRFDNAILREVDMTDTNFIHTTFRGADLTSATITPETLLTGASFDGNTKFPDGLTWQDTNFFTTDFNGMKLILDDQTVDGQDLTVKFTNYAGCYMNRMKAHGASLNGADLTSASMWQLQAEDIDLSNTILTNVPMHYSNLRRVDLSNSVLSGTGIKHSNLQDCNLIGADMSTTDFDTTTTLIGCTFDSTTVFPVGFDPISRGLIDVNAEPLPTWPDCYDNGMVCDTVNFALVAESLWHKTFNDGSFVDTNWESVGFGGSQIKNTDFTGANLNGASANHARFDDAILRQVDMTGTNFEHSCFRGADLSSSTTSSDTNFYGASFDPYTIFPDGMAWQTSSFFTSNGFNGMKLLLDDQDVSGQDLTVGNKFTNFFGCSFNRMKAHGSSLNGADLTKAGMWQLQAEDIDLSYTILVDVPLHYSNLRRVNFEGALLQGTGLLHSNLQDCNLIGADLSSADFDTTTVLVGCSYDDTTLFPDNFDPLSRGLINVNAEPLPTWPDCYDNGLNCDTVNFVLVQEPLWSATLSGASYVDSNWEKVGFGGAQAKDADFTSANLSGASANHVSFQGSVLRSADLSGTDLEYANIMGADLTSATYDDTTVFIHLAFGPTTKFFDGLTWLATSFFTTDLKGMRLIMDDQDATGLDFASKVQTYVKSSFNRMIANGASFQGCDLTGADMWSLQGATADFSSAILANVVIRYSNLVDANFENAVLTGTSLLNTNMAGCNLIGADLSSAELDSTTTMTDCIYDDNTSFPAGFDPLSNGLRDINAPTLSPTPAPTTPSPTPAPTTPSLEDLANNRLVFDDIPCFPMGINLASVVYYSNQWTFKNAFAEGGGCCYPADAKVDADGNLLEAAPEDYPDYWKAGRNLIYRVDGQYPNGTYILHAQGNGTISLAFDVGPTQYVTVPTDPEGLAVPVTPSASGVQLTIEATSATDPVKDISFMLQEYEESTSTSPFTPTFIDTLAGMNVLRFMDFGMTNGNNIVHWQDRNSLTTVSQSRVTRRIKDIASVAVPAQQMPFTDIFGLEFTTTGPHGLSTGQVVDIDNLIGTVTVARQGGEDFTYDLSQVWYPRIIEATGPNTFLMNVGSWSWNKETDSISSVSADTSADRVTVKINPGVAYEYMIDMAKETGSDPWFCVPHLATENYVQNMANMIATSGLGSSTTVYVELSNEVWNGIFSQSHWAYGKERELGLPSSSQAYGQRAKEVFDIFEAAFSAAGPDAPTLNRVLASQSVNTWISEQVIIGAGGAGSFDSLAIAPYFAASPADVYALSTDGQSVDGVTVTDVLQLCLEDIFGNNRDYLIAQKQVAEDYGGVLIAYEGGQHLGGQGNSPLGGRMEDDIPYQDLMIEANRDPRMHDLYQAYFKLWGEIVGPSGVFAHFSFIGSPSKWGSWGVKESYYKADTVEESPKWMSVKGIADTCGSVEEIFV